MLNFFCEFIRVTLENLRVRRKLFDTSLIWRLSSRHV